MGSNLHCEDHLSYTIILDQNHVRNICGKLTWHCCMCCNRTNGRMEFEDGWHIKPSFITMDGWSESLSADLVTKLQKKITSSHLHWLGLFHLLIQINGYWKKWSPHPGVWTKNILVLRPVPQAMGHLGYHNSSLVFFSVDT